MEIQRKVFILALFIALVLTPVFRWVAYRLKFLDLPGSLKSHKEPTPYLGGLAVYLGFIIPVFVLTCIFCKIPGIGILAGGTIVLIMGIIDDARKLPFYVKLIFQFAAALCVVFTTVRLTIDFLPYWLNLLLSVIWLVGITNAFNIIDIMDGLSAGVAFICAVFFFLIAMVTGNMDVQVLTLALAGAALGFLRYNFPKASIFMGDTGSGFIGFILASIAMAVSYTGRNDLALFSPVLILGVPVYDTALITILRIKKRKSIFKGSKDHLALRLISLGFSRLKAVLFIYFITLVLGVIALVIVKLSILWAVVCYILLIMAGLLGGRVLSKVEVG